MRYDPYLVATAGLLLVRLLTLGAFPLLDTSEARYAEIARLMAENGDWITPWFDPGTPFWGKPPLAFWLSALSFRLFGINEFAARFPHWLLAGATLWLVAGIARAAGSPTPWRAPFFLAASALFFVAGGAVLTDIPLLFAIALSFAAAFHVLLAGNARWRWLFFVGLGLGALTKGPLAWVLTLGPLAVWSLASGRTADLLWNLPWGRGLALSLAIALPWYAAAEAKTPGFLDYFLFGEHFRRFVVPGWAGDLYGTAHDQPRGTIWLYAVAAVLPWPLLLPALKGKVGRGDTPPGSGFFLAWGLAPPVFFTFAGNILWTYVLPGLPGLALWLDRRLGESGRIPFALAAATPLVFAAFVVLANDPAQSRSEKFLIAGLTDGAPIHYLDQRPFSARFYSRGRAGLVRSEGLPMLLGTAASLRIAVPKDDAAGFARRHPQAVEVGGSARFVLYLFDGGTPMNQPTTMHKRLARALAVSTLAFATAAFPAQHPSAGEEIARWTGCLACHSVEKRIIGKAYRDVAAKYRNWPFAEKIIRWKVRHGTGKNKSVPMPAFDEKALSDADLDIVAKWILGL